MVYLFLADGFEEIEALAVVDILRRAEIDIKMVSIGENIVKGAHNISVKADMSIENIKKTDIEMLILPGGRGYINLKNNSKVKELIEFSANNGQIIGAICAAPSILGEWGLINGKSAVCFPGYEDKLLGAIYTNKKVVTDGKIITSKGAGTAHDFAFELVAQLKGEELANSVREKMQYE